MSVVETNGAAAQVPENWEPKIIAFCCHWCTYTGADLAGLNRMNYPANVRVLRIPCSGRMNPQYVIEALNKGWEFTDPVSATHNLSSSGSMAQASPHIWQFALPADLEAGEHTVEVTGNTLRTLNNLARQLERSPIVDSCSITTANKEGRLETLDYVKGKYLVYLRQPPEEVVAP